MSAPEPHYSIKTPVPEDAAFVSAALVVLLYVREDGTNGYVVHSMGELPITSYLGMTVIAQDHIKKWGREG